MIISGDDPVINGARRFEVFTGAGKRRDWSDTEKASIVAECWPGGERVAAVACRHALDPSQIYGWRKVLVRRCKDHGLAVPVALEQQDPAFVPVMVAPDDTPEPAPDPVRSRRRRRAEPAAIELEIGGALVRIGSSADADTIAAVITALRASR
ncbi:MAG: transposase [Sphingomonadales bacterium]|nr:transposase [Sphingomonadales bacterium]NCQ21594.1 transposase [Sphingomonadales bacterium]NCT04690.1 transposase [Sphingomonadales bacterium]